MAEKSQITPDRLRQLLRYEPETGKLFWNRRVPSDFVESSVQSREHNCNIWNSRFAGREAMAARTANGYLRGAIKPAFLLAHRVIWAITHGAWPANQIDHINGDRGDNRISNLRVVTSQDNNRNAALRSNNTSGHNGVSWVSRVSRWRVQIRDGGKIMRVGDFDTIEEAAFAQKSAQAELGYHPNHGKRHASY